MQTRRKTCMENLQNRIVYICMYPPPTIHIILTLYDVMCIYIQVSIILYMNVVYLSMHIIVITIICLHTH